MYAQTEYATGTIVDDATYDFHEQFDVSQYEISPPKVYLLDQFVPKVGNQLKFPHDIGWSIASAATIVDAVYEGNFNKENSLSSIRSPYFVNMLWSEELNPCKEGLSLSRTIDRLHSTGIPRLKDYVNICPSSKEEKVIADAAQLTKYKYNKVFNRDASVSEKVYRIKNQVSLDRPVIIAFHCPTSFVSAQEFWSPKEAYSEEFPLHTVVVVGYDDELYGGSFKILNSWSKNWGNEGFMWVRYQDADFFRYGYSLGYRSREGENLSVIKGELDFNDAISRKVIPFIRFNPRGYYHFAVGANDLQFNLTGLMNKPFYLKMYYKSAGEIQQIYPLESWRSSLFEYSFESFEIPGDKNYYTIEKDKISQLYVFISLKNIDDIDFSPVVKESETIYDVLFAEDYKFSREVIWDNENTHFYSRLYDQEIIPLVVALEFTE